MIVLLDEMIDRYARLILRIADFFGIDERLLVFIWLILSSAIWALLLVSRQSFIVWLFIAMVIFFIELMDAGPWFLMIGCLHCQAKMYGISRLAPVDSGRRRRTLLYLLLLILSFRYFGGELHHWWMLIAIIKVAIPLHLYRWFMDHPNRGKKVRLKDLVKSAAKKLRELLLPNPAPTPVPQPS